MKKLRMTWTFVRVELTIKRPRKDNAEIVATELGYNMQSSWIDETIEKRFLLSLMLDAIFKFVR